MLFRSNTSGTIQWQKTLGSPGYDRGYGIAVDSSGNVYINGSSDAGSTGVETFQLAKYNTSGTIQWQRMLGRTSRPCIGYAVATDSSGNVYVNGSMNNSGLTDIFFGKFPGNGSLTGGYNVGSYTNVYYVASSCTDAASTLTDAASSGTDAASTLTDAASSLTDAASTLTSTIKQI